MRKNSVFHINRLLLAALLAPGVIMYVFIVLLPLVFGARYSFYDWAGGNKMTFVGLDNYLQMINDKSFWAAFGNNMRLMVVIIVFQLTISFIIAILLNSRRTRFSEFHRFAIFLPVVVSSVVISVLWKLIYNNEVGIINTFLRAVGLGGLARPWLGDPKIAIYSISVVVIWQFVGIYLVIFMAGLQGIPAEIYEVAEIDGASAWYRATRITMPLMAETILVAVMLCIAGNMKIFEHIFVMTGGGPARATTVLSIYAYNQSFKYFQYGYGSTVSMGLFILCLLIIAISRIGARALTKKTNTEY